MSEDVRSKAQAALAEVEEITSAILPEPKPANAKFANSSSAPSRCSATSRARASSKRPQAVHEQPMKTSGGRSSRAWRTSSS